MYLSKPLLSPNNRIFWQGRGTIGGIPWIVVLLCVITITVSLALPAGFAGWDDLHYLRAALRWIDEGINLPADHWSTRLPYVLTLAASLRIFGLSELALIVPNTILFAIMLLLLWRIARQVSGERAALCSVLVLAATPLFFRMPTTYYPEVLEIVFAGAATTLTLSSLSLSSLSMATPVSSSAVPALSRPQRDRRTFMLLFAAGLLGGSGILVRQTALAIPVALAVLIFLSNRGQSRRAAANVLVLAAGYAVPVLLECLFYLAMTGNPLERLKIDSRHVLIPSGHLRGGTFTGGSPLFNWKLASQWDVPGTLRIHWTVNPLLRVFVAPALLLTPFLCLGGMIISLRMQGIIRIYAIFAAVGFLAQYVLNTFVLAIAPDTRYFSVSVALATPLAGYLLSRLTYSRMLASSTALAVFCVLLMSLAPAPAHRMAAFQEMAKRNPLLHAPLVHASPELMDAAAILLAEHPELRRKVTLSPVRDAIPIGDLAVSGPDGWTGIGFDGHCTGGGEAWQPLASDADPSIGWSVLDRLGLIHLLPARLAGVLAREPDRLTLARHLCRAGR